MKLHLNKELFKDFNFTSFSLSNGVIDKVNLYRKKSELELFIILNDKINIKDVLNFESFLEKRFCVNLAVINIEYTEDNIQNIFKKQGYFI